MIKHQRISHFFVLCFVFILIVALVPATAAHATVPTTWHVTKLADTADGVCNSDCSLREALAVANGGDSIVFNVTGTILLTAGPFLISNTNLAIAGPGATQLTIDGQSLNRIFAIYKSTVSLTGLTLTHGLVNLANDGATDMGGGAIESWGDSTSGSHLTLDQTVLTYNTVYCNSGVSNCNTGLNGNGGAIASLTNSSLTITNSSLTHNTTTGFGGAVFFQAATATAGNDLILTNDTLTNNQASDSAIGDGGAIMIAVAHTATLSGVTIANNTAGYAGGGLFSTSSTLGINNSTFDSNHALGTTGFQQGGAAIYMNGSTTLTLTNSTIMNNTASARGGGFMNNGGTATIANSTFSGNTASGASLGGGAIYSSDALTLLNDTLSGNNASASTHGGALYLTAGAGVTIKNSILANSVGSSDCYTDSVSPWVSNVNNLVETNDGFHPCDSVMLSVDPMLAGLAADGGPTKTMALLAGSPAMDAGSNTVCTASPVSNLDQRGYKRPIDGDRNGTAFCDIGAYEFVPPVEVRIGGSVVGTYHLLTGASTRQSYAAVSNGPVKISSPDGATQLIASERDIYKINNVNTSFAEMMALPNSQLDMTYWLPWYNDLDLDTQLRFANVSGLTALVHVFINGAEMTAGGSPFTLLPGASTRVSFVGVSDGPVKITSNRSIVAAERLIYPVNGVNTSFAEMMALPNNQLNTAYWLPWYNDVDLDTQLRFANTTNTQASVQVFIGSQEMVGSPFLLGNGASTRVSFLGISDGPVRIVSTQPIVASERVIYKVNDVNTSFSEMMALPAGQLDTSYVLPLYNDVDLDTQLRFANASAFPASVHVSIGGVEMPGSPFALGIGASTRVSFAGISNGPVQITGDRPIVASERLLYPVNGVNTSFSEMMALPHLSLDTSYWLPWYNNVDLDTQLRFGVP